MKENRHLIGIGIVAIMVILLCAVCATTSVTAADVSKVPAGSFVGSAQSNVYHKPSCGDVKNIHQENLVVFNSVADACAAGYRPCKVCNPPACPTPTVSKSPSVTLTPSVNKLASTSITPTPASTQETKSTPEFPLPIAGAAMVVIVSAIYMALRKRS